MLFYILGYQYWKVKYNGRKQRWKSTSFYIFCSFRRKRNKGTFLKSKSQTTCDKSSLLLRLYSSCEMDFVYLRNNISFLVNFCASVTFLVVTFLVVRTLVVVRKELCCRFSTCWCIACIQKVFPLLITLFTCKKKYFLCKIDLSTCFDR